MAFILPTRVKIRYLLAGAYGRGDEKVVPDFLLAITTDGKIDYAAARAAAQRFFPVGTEIKSVSLEKGEAKRVSQMAKDMGVAMMKNLVDDMDLLSVEGAVMPAPVNMTKPGTVPRQRWLGFFSNVMGYGSKNEGAGANMNEPASLASSGYNAEDENIMNQGGGYRRRRHGASRKTHKKVAHKTKAPRKMKATRRH
jgi:hypothetical protein